MNKTDLVNYVAEEAGLTKVDAAKAVEALLGGVTTTLQEGGKVSLVGFGSFGTRMRKATKGRNPQTGAEIDIPAANQVAFKPGKQLKEAVNA